MKYKQIFASLLCTIVLCSAASAQKAEITINLNEAFFDALLEAVFQNFDPLEFPISGIVTDRRDLRTGFQQASFIAGNHTIPPRPAAAPACDSIKILREMNGVRTAVRFRDGRVYVPLAFSGSYAPPFVGCVPFAGIAESNIDLEFDQAGQRLIGRIRVLNVNLNGSGGVGGTVIARMIQSSIDKRLNPLEIISLEKMSFMVPIRNAGNLRLRALSARPETGNGSMSVRIAYAFEKN